MDEEEKKKSALDRANDLYGAYQNARTIYSLAKNTAKIARSAATAAELLATSEIWVPIVVVIVVISIITFLVVLGGQGQAAQSSPSPTPIQNAGDVSSLFQIQGGTQDEINKFYSIISEPLSYPRYKDLLTRRGPINVVFQEGQSFCGARVYNKDQIIFYNFMACGNDSFKKYEVIHESGHIIDGRNGRVGQSFDYQSLLNSDPQCFSSDGYLRSYPYANMPNSPRGTERDESFAESVSSFLIATPNNHSFNNFQSECPDIYNWVLNNIYQ